MPDRADMHGFEDTVSLRFEPLYCEPATNLQPCRCLFREDPTNLMKPQGASSTQEVLAGLVERITFHNVENGFCVLRAKARGHRDLVTVVGHAATIAAGEWVTASGEWVNDRTHGQQFKARFLRTSAPTSIDGIEKYLSSGMIRGIGPVYAKKLVRVFGEKVFDVIETQPDRLREIDGIGPVRAKGIITAWAEQKVVREIMVFRHSHGVGAARAVRIFKTYGTDAIQIMAENPYRLAREIRGIGFKTADAIAMKLGIEKTAMIRVRAGISYALTEAMDDGHCGLPRDELMPAAEGLLEVPLELVRTALDCELTEGTVNADNVGEMPCVFLTGLHCTERIIAERLHQLTNGPLPWPWIDPDKALPWVAQRVGLVLAESQTGRHQARPCFQSAGHYRRSRRWQNYHRQRHSAHSRRKRCPAPAMRADRSRRQTHDRGDRF
jgi:exodeoxyribonuclease V alpha subunit